ncbi:Alpha-ketoglutarate-dependent dioxygenase alkB 2 [Desmophyllum pertusum]|uniref:DNA oxidative demethylase ALKBH2 n=1 Tax=Desmophyllum pertusum TaxID=174260 RepID=A0A9W9ZVE0_9CNID|nr:Alpha-ketoglutarate-dependent dioxygenase alkB 2 [Desmophyllum pertusum]
MIDSYFVNNRSKCAKRKMDQEEREEEPEMKAKVFNTENLNKSNNSSCQATSSSKLSFLEMDRKVNLQWKQIISENLNLEYVQLFSETEADVLFQEAEKVIKYNADSKVFVYGKWHKVPRKQAAYGDMGLTYTFSGTTVVAQPWNNAPFLKHIGDLVSCLSGGHKFNFVLVNRYNDGNDHMGEHRDDEADLVPKSAIASVSVGQARDFIFRHRDARGSGAKRKIDPVKFELSHGSLLIMNHPTNVYWFHSLPVRKKVICPRINLTFRQMVVKK